MPYSWTETDGAVRLDLWPHQSMTPRGFAWFIGATATMFALPLLAVLGTPVLWVLLAFFLAAVLAVWRALGSNRAARDIHERLEIAGDEVTLEHRPAAQGAVQSWRAHRSWVVVHLRGGPVENYLTLTGGSREVELGRFLTPQERATLAEELRVHLARR